MSQRETPEVLRGLYQETLDRFWDKSTFERVIALEEIERLLLIDDVEAEP